MPEKYSARVLQPDRLRRDMPLHRLQIAYASFQGTVDSRLLEWGVNVDFYFVLEYSGSWRCAKTAPD